MEPRVSGGRRLMHPIDMPQLDASTCTEGRIRRIPPPTANVGFRRKGMRGLASLNSMGGQDDADADTLTSYGASAAAMSQEGLACCIDENLPGGSFSASSGCSTWGSHGSFAAALMRMPQAACSVDPSLEAAGRASSSSSPRSASLTTEDSHSTRDTFDDEPAD
eukprot:TRINITY_DN35821_c0_g2_i1.p1 TRINITY_DN35821_c0_g2~~TRINITY_DN35821_c0_g2_i1.p1  ORF type:complete len:181 (+),score=20.42 TRINITY_DN35821_c0_g2_i1:54-545(+)